MKVHFKPCLLVLAGAMALGPAARGQDDLGSLFAPSVPPPSAPPKFSAAKLQELAAPIALHPDPLIAVILPAAEYPLEIIQAASFLRDPSNLALVDEQPWDANVKAVARVPAVIQKMGADLAWTMDLGQAYVHQRSELLATIQFLRAKAQQLGALQTSPQHTVVVTNAVVQQVVQNKMVSVTNTIVEIHPANPAVVYVPEYSPTVYYAPPPPGPTAPPPAVTFAAGVAVGAVAANNAHPPQSLWHYPPPPPGYHPPAPPPPGYHPPAGAPPPPGYHPPAGAPPPSAYHPPAGAPPPSAYHPPAGAPPPSGYHPPTGAPPPSGSHPPTGAPPAHPPQSSAFHPSGGSEAHSYSSRGSYSRSYSGGGSYSRGGGGGRR
jgi:hypothetical protein